VIWNGNLRFVIQWFDLWQSTARSCILKLTAFIPILQDCNHSKQITYSIEAVYDIHEQEWRSAVTTIRLNTSLCIQEDTSSWNSRLRRTQVRFLFSQYSYLQTVLISVFAVFGLSCSREMRLYVFSCVCFVCFRSRLFHPLIVASGWNKEQCIPEILPLLRHRTFCIVLCAFCYNYRIMCLVCLKFLATSWLHGQ